MNWTAQYTQKITTPERAVASIRTGDRVWVQPGCAAPTVLTDALLTRASGLRDVEIVHMLSLGRADYTLPQYEGHFRHNGLFLGANVREAVAAGRAVRAAVVAFVAPPLGRMEKKIELPEYYLP